MLATMLQAVPTLEPSSDVRGISCSADNILLEGEVSWMKVNVDMGGYYMVHYGEEGWDALISLLDHDHTALSSKDRTNLIHNAFQLVR